MKLSSFLITIFSIPGIIAHEFGHKLFCDMFNVKVHKVRYFAFKNPPGFVIHDQPKGFTQTFFITAGPFIFNTLLAILFAKFSMIYSLMFAWFSISIASQSFPSKGDAKSLWKETNRHVRKNILAIVGYPISGLLMLVNMLKSFWVDLVYGILVYLAVIFFFF